MVHIITTRDSTAKMVLLLKHAHLTIQPEMVILAVAVVADDAMIALAVDVKAAVIVAVAVVVAAVAAAAADVAKARQ